MPIPQLNKRSYGFSDRNKPREQKVYGAPEKNEEPPRVSPPIFRPPQSKKPGSEQPKWLKFVLAILAMVLWVLKKLWQGLVYLWSRRPRLNKDTKEEFRRKLGVSVLVFLVVGFLASTILVAWASKDLPDPDRLTDRSVAQSTKIYDRTGEHMLYEIFADEKRTIVELDQIPKDLVNGVIATEDTKFYEHGGIRPFSILRSMVYGLLGKSRIGSGASTLTQQLVKNAVLTNERKISRKIKEIILSIRLEQKYTKDQILKIYFNEIPYGSTNYGVESAAQSYFGKSASELNLQESATLAGLPKAPTKYLNDLESLKQRRDFVLFRMFEEGYITEEQKNEAQSQELTLSRHFGEIKAPHFVLYVKEQLVAQFGEQMVDTGGLRVITSLDWDKQEAAQKAVDEKGTELLELAGGNNLSLVAMDPKTGQVLAMIGSKNFEDEEIDGQFNVATLGKRQPGSSFKPIVYAAAFEKGYTPDTVLFDVRTNFAVSGQRYEPQNYDLKERGPVTIRQALQGSLNIPAVKTLYLVGDKKGVEFAERLGYTTLSQGDFGLSLVLGGGEVHLIEHVAAYGVFASGGIKQPTTSILKVEDSDGDVLYEWKQEKGDRVLDSGVAATVSNVLSDDASRAYIFGAGGVLTLPGRPVAAKTGTTNNFVDAWTVGYTPQLVAGVWLGNTNNSPMKAGFGGTQGAAPVWNAFMKEALKDAPVEGFPAPPPNDAKKAVLRGSAGGLVTLSVNKSTGKIATSSTPAHLIEERSYLQPHSILHYVRKDDPRGDPPENPADDPQYLIWEAAIQNWIERRKAADPTWNVSFDEPPTEEDDAYSIELIPELEILSPREGEVLTSRQINPEITASAVRGITRAIYYIDSEHVGTVDTYPFNLDYNARNLESGNHTLKVVVEDDLGNRTEQEVSFTLSAGAVSASAYWQNTGTRLGKSDFPAALFLNHVKIDQFEKINIYIQQDTQNKTLITTITDFASLYNDLIPFTWQNYPGAGNWILTAETVLSTGISTQDQIRIAVE